MAGHSVQNVNGDATEIDVVVIGAGPVGLVSSIMLSRIGIKHQVYERHHGTGIHPKAVGTNQRTMEVDPITSPFV